VTGDEFIRRVRRLGRKTETPVEVFKAHSKGSHRTLYYGDRRTTVKHGEIRMGLLHAMCKQLGIQPKDL